MSNRIYVYIKPEKDFADLSEITECLKHRLPAFDPILDESEDMISLSPFTSYIDFPPGGFATDYLELFLWLDFSKLFDEEFYSEIKRYVSTIAQALGSGEWWYTSEMLMVSGENLSLSEFELALIEHGIEYMDVKKLKGFSSSEIWYIRDSISDNQ